MKSFTQEASETFAKTYDSSSLLTPPLADFTQVSLKAAVTQKSLRKRLQALLHFGKVPVLSKYY